MKTVLSVTSTVLLLFLSAKADLISVTATGTINTLGNSLSSTAYNPGTKVHYIFEFNTEENGYYILNDKNLTCYDDNFSSPEASGTNHYFFADFKGEFAMPDYVQTNTLLNYGYISTGIYNGTPFECSFLVGGSKSHCVNFYNEININSWRVGTSVWGDEYSYLSDGSFEYTYSDLTITGISKIKISKTSVPVPESSIFPLVLCGITMLGAFGALRRREN